jgi:hypothetical protein
MFMATVNGIGTMRYDWSRRADGTSEATLWLVVFFLPIVPLRRERLRVVGTQLERAGIVTSVLALCGAGDGWQTQIEVLGSVANSRWRVLRTYVNGFIGVPFITFFGPMLLLVAGTLMTLKRGDQISETFQVIIGGFAFADLIWTACVVAFILDHSAGRHHMDANAVTIRRKRGQDEPAFVSSDRVSPPSSGHLVVGWIAAALCVLFGTATVVCLFLQQFEIVAGGVFWTALFGWIAREWIEKGRKARRPKDGK